MARKFEVSAVFRAIDMLTAPIKRMQRRMGRFTKETTRGLKRANRALNSFGRSLRDVGKTALKVGAIGLGSIATGLTLIMREFSKIEDAEAAFTPLLGGADKARKAVAALTETAAVTPFQFATLSDSAKQLLPVMEGDIQRMITTVKMLGDTAGGNVRKLESITRGYTKAMLKGKTDMESLNIIAEAGVPIYQELAKQMGVKVNAAFFRMISSGRVASDRVTKAFEKMTAKGGIFFRGMEISSKTVSGRFSTLRDNISLATAEIGEALAPTVKELITQAIGIAKELKAWAKANKGIIGTKFKEYVIAVKDAVMGAIDFFRKYGGTIVKITGTVIALIAVFKAFSAVMVIVNAVMLANPIGLIIVAITALIAAVAAAIIWWDELKAAFLSLPGPIKTLLAIIALPITALVKGARVLMDAWEPLGQFFSELWIGIFEMFKAGYELVKPLVNLIARALQPIIDVLSFVSDAINDFLGIGDDAIKVEATSAISQGAATRPQVISPGARMASTLEERRSVTTSEITIRDDSGRAEVTGGKLGDTINLVPTGAF